MLRQAPKPKPREREPRTSVRSYLVVGPRRVAGQPTGSVVQLDLTDAAARALINAGHVTPTEPTGVKKKGKNHGQVGS